MSRRGAGDEVEAQVAEQDGVAAAGSRIASSSPTVTPVSDRRSRRRSPSSGRAEGREVLDDRVRAARPRGPRAAPDA